MLTGKNLIGYSSSAQSDKPIHVMPQIDGVKSNYSFYEASFNEIDRAAFLANEAFTAYRLFTGEQKAMFLEKIAGAIAANKDQLIDVAMQETNLAKPRLEGELQRTINQSRLFAALLREGSWVKAIIDTAQPDRKPLPKPDIRQMQIPLGPVAVFGAGNFPFAFSVAGGDTVSAFAAGCPVVYKVHPGHPATSEMVASLVIKTAKNCQMPEGIFSLIYGNSHEVSLHLVANEFIKAVGFTGSFNAGKALSDAASKRPVPIPVFAEMGSVNPVFVLPGALEKNAEDVAEKLAASNLLSAGQFCTNPGIIVGLESDQTKKFITHFASQIRNADAGIMLTENICGNYKNASEAFLHADHVTLSAKGKESDSTNKASSLMFQTEAKKFLLKKELWHEVFGPSSIHVIAGSKAELFAVANALEGQLTASIWANENDLEEYKELIHVLELKAGRIIFNNVPTGVEVTHAMVHGGPYPATTNSSTTSVGTNAIYRFTRAVCYQNFPDEFLPAELKNENNLHIWRMVNGMYGNNSVV